MLLACAKLLFALNDKRLETLTGSARVLSAVPEERSARIVAYVGKLNTWTNSCRPKAMKKLLTAIVDQANFVSEKHFQLVKALEDEKKGLGNEPLRPRRRRRRRPDPQRTCVRGCCESSTLCHAL